MKFDFDFSTDENTEEMDYFRTHEKFIDKFGHGVPTEMLPTRIKKDEILAAMKQCLEDGEDHILEILNVEINHDVLY